MYSEGSDIVPQSNETALHYFKKAADMVRLHDSVYWNVYHITIIFKKVYCVKGVSHNRLHELLEVLM